MTKPRSKTKPNALNAADLEPLVAVIRDETRKFIALGRQSCLDRILEGDAAHRDLRERIDHLAVRTGWTQEALVGWAVIHGLGVVECAAAKFSGGATTANGSAATDATAQASPGAGSGARVIRFRRRDDEEEARP